MSIYKAGCEPTQNEINKAWEWAYKNKYQYSSTWELISDYRCFVKREVEK